MNWGKSKDLEEAKKRLSSQHGQDLAEKLRDIHPAKPRTYFKGAEDVV